MTMSNIKYWIGNENLQVKTMVPYSDSVCDFLSTLSKRILSDKTATAYPDVSSFAFWCRKSNISKLRTEYDDGKKRLGRGLVFHITPSNVPINFAFSFAFGLLSGNSNIVRIPSKPFPQTEIVSQFVSNVLNENTYDEIRRCNAFIQYERNDEITSQLSAKSDGRIIWGGDKTIQNIRSFPISTQGVEIVFADRYSFCLIDAEKIINLEDATLDRLANSFYNDTYLMDQNACSSPHLILWKNGIHTEGKDRFWQSVLKSAQKYNLAAVNVVDKYVQLCRLGIEYDFVESSMRYDNLLYCLKLKYLPQKLDQVRGKFGLFFEYDLNDMEEITECISTKFQTLTYFGIDSEQLGHWIVRNRLKGIDRVVPIGSALDIGVIWDGYDIIKTLSRIIDIK
jgi:hypothetical protein